MALDEPKPIMAAAKPKRRWFQFGLKSLFVLPVVVGLFLALYLYWDDWRKYRPPYQEYDREQYDSIFWTFLDDLKVGRLDHAYESTSDRFKNQMSRSQFESLIQSHPLIRDWRDSQEVTSGIRHPYFGKAGSLKNWSEHYIFMKGPDKNATELWVWVVMDDSFFYRRPPSPKVGEIQIRDVDWPPPETNPPLKPSWDGA